LFGHRGHREFIDRITGLQEITRISTWPQRKKRKLDTGLTDKKGGQELGDFGGEL